jgi:hypothetical protein
MQVKKRQGEIMNKLTTVAMTIAAIWIGGCAMIHDGKGWEHTGDPETHQDDQPYILEHKH